MPFFLFLFYLFIFPIAMDESGFYRTTCKVMGGRRSNTTSEEATWGFSLDVKGSARCWLVGFACISPHLWV
ncbi:hypothetical protein BDW42DRAFT_159249 [Aspergillus taichungensis]|uniref:Secreted protein n=1 Tax=Aspergillus taichungensis TaxID=482145 RepID=A0A2J5I7Y7_9EURO|nr:hypothetical protein BDW42DRAFT_159249 [Aspergillus taichungensis]